MLAYPYLYLALAIFGCVIGEKKALRCNDDRFAVLYSYRYNGLKELL